MSYAQYPEATQSFYYPPNPNPYNNFQSYNYAQEMQLNATGLLPASFTTGVPAPIENVGEVSWYPYAPTKLGFDNYVMASGASRIRQMTRDPMNKLGTRNPLRSDPPVALSMSKPWFNDSEYRLDYITGMGCVPRG